MRGGIDVVWLPLGAGASGVVRWSGRAYEALSARGDRRPRCALFHAALLIRVANELIAVEVTPQWSTRWPGATAPVSGPVGSRRLGRSRWFRYEVRCSPGGWLPDARHAAAKVRVSEDEGAAAAVLSALPSVPQLTWGRDEIGAGEMWNSNSVAAWLLAAAGVDPQSVSPPDGGRAPGWRAGIVSALSGMSDDVPRPRPPGR